MARARHVALLALVMLAMIGLACAADAPKSEPSEDDYEEDDDSEFLVGTRSTDPPSANRVVAAPIGGPVPPGAFDTSPPSAASSLSAVAGTVAAGAIAGFFYF